MNHFLKRLRRWLHYNNFTSNYHFIVVFLVLTFLTISSNKPDCYLIGIITILLFVYVFIKHKPLCLVMTIITTMIVLIFGLKVLIYNTSKTTLDNKLIVKEVEDVDLNSKQGYQKVLLSSGITKYLYYNKVENSYYMKVGDIYHFKGKVMKQEGRNTPNGFDYASYLKYQNIIGIIEEESVVYDKRVFTLSLINNSLGKYYDKHFTYSDIIKALVIGDKNGIEDELMNNIQSVGISHLFVVSGLHVGMLTSFLSFFLSKFKVPKKPTNIIIYIFLGIYLVITNFMVSVIRVTLAYILKNILKSKVTPLDKISINIIIVLLINPFYIFSYSFILTYLISSMIIIISPLLSKKKTFITYILNMVIISISSVLVTLPIVVNINPDINLMSIIYNIIYIPLVSYFLLPLSIILSFLPFLNHFCSFIYNAFTFSINLLSNFNFLTFTFPVISKALVLCYYLILLLSIYMLENKKGYVSLLFVVYLFGWYNKAYIDINDKVIFLDVSEGDATHIKTRFNKTNILIDTGISTDDEIITYLKKEGIRTIDLIIISHGDNDHNGNLDKLLNNFKVKGVMLSCYDYNTFNILQNNNFNNYCLLKDGDVFEIDGIVFEVLWPVEDMNDVNNNSLVFTMNYDNTVFLFTGDIEKGAEEKIIDIYKQLDVDVLKIAHHASNTSTHAKWLNNVKFKVGVAMTGNKNTFGFPNKYTVERLKKYDVYYTSEHDTITFSKAFFKKKWKILLLREK